MLGYIRAVATDFDGTLVMNQAKPSKDVLLSIENYRQAGGVVLLVTGRILKELYEVFPDVLQYFDAIVAENGCVIVTKSENRELVSPVENQLYLSLVKSGVNIRKGQVILAGSSNDRISILEHIHRLGVDCQLVFNKGELMVLPSGVSKGTGLFEALGDIGVSHHSTLGVGDAENDHGLLDVCEVGVAVSNATLYLKSFADIVLELPNGRGMVNLFETLTKTNTPAMHSVRWQLRLGETVNEDTAMLPSSQIDILICGESGSGKSYLTGLVAERLIGLGYCVLVVDPEGDHQDLGRLRQVTVINCGSGTVSPERVVSTLTKRFASVVLDMSLMAKEERHLYLEKLASCVDKSRSVCGLPHWIIEDEAHDTSTGLREKTSKLGGDKPSGKWGHCLTTFRPDMLDPIAVEQMGAVILTGVGGGKSISSKMLDLLKGLSFVDDTQLNDIENSEANSSYLLVKPEIDSSTSFKVAARVTTHKRHTHKYTEASLPSERCFYFRNEKDQIVGLGSNLQSLVRILATCEPGVIRHHSKNHDISNWVKAVFQDKKLARKLAEVENQLNLGSIPVDIASGKMVHLVKSEYAL